MTRYYFDLRDGDELIVDEEGYEMATLEAVQREAVLSLTDQSRDVAERGLDSVAALAIDVRDEDGPVMRVTFKVELVRKN